MLIINVQGNLGSGKTIFAVSRVIRYVDEGLEFFSNVNVKGFTKPLERVTQFGDLSNCGVLIDDVIAWLDSRQSVHNTPITWKFLQARHREINPIIYTSQIITGADLRLRFISDCVIETTLIDFPRFHLIGSNNYGVFMDVHVEYGKRVIEAYNTYEIIEQKIKLNELIDMWELCNGNKKLFTGWITIRYGFTNKLSDLILECIKIEDFKILCSIMKDFSYRLINIP